MGRPVQIVPDPDKTERDPAGADRLRGHQHTGHRLPAVELSYLSPEEQETFLQAMDEVQAAPSLSQAQRLKKLAQEGNFTMDAAREILNEVKKGDLERVTFRNEQLRRFFPRSYTAQQMQDTIIKLLDQWQKKKSREHER